MFTLVLSASLVAESRFLPTSSIYLGLMPALIAGCQSLRIGVGTLIGPGLRFLLSEIRGVFCLGRSRLSLCLPHHRVPIPAASVLLPGLTLPRRLALPRSPERSEDPIGPNFIILIRPCQKVRFRLVAALPARYLFPLLAFVPSPPPPVSWSYVGPTADHISL